MATPCPDPDLLRKLCGDETLSNRDIGEKFGVGTSKLWGWIKEHGIDRRSSRNNEGKMPSKSALETHYRDKSPLEIGKIYGVSNVTVMNWLDRLGIPRKTFVEIRNSPEYLEKITKTCIDRYGTPTVLANSEMQSMISGSRDVASKGEIDLIDSISSLTGVSFHRDRTSIPPLELDGLGVVNGRKVAIEFNGLYWHSEKGGKGRKYHHEKWKRCKDLDIRLYSIWSDEYRENKDKILRYIYMNLGMGKTRIGARSCRVSEISTVEARAFHDRNHIQSSPPSFRFSAGLFLDNSLIQVMSFGSHHRDRNIMVLNRYSGEFDIQVVGGASKLLAMGRKHIPGKIITWSDNRFSWGNVYEKIGFKRDVEYGPDYQWTDFYRRYSKQSRQKKLTGQDMKLTEKEYNECLGLSRVWDCGKIRWVIG